MRERPLSPHLSIYRMWAHPMLWSILHRMTGAVLSVGLIVMALWLMAAASGPEAYDRLAVVLAHPLLKVLYAGLLLAFAYHFCTGVRHLVWDTGAKMERGQSRRSVGYVIAGTVVLFVVLGWLVFFGAGGAS